MIVFYLVYLFIGAAIFSSIEYSNEKEIIDDLKSKRQQFYQKVKSCDVSDAYLESFITKILEANSKGISAINNLTVEPNWSFGQAVFFSGTVLTTIGYGHVSPLSVGGKVFCIFYAIFGIPMTLILISACVERLLVVTNKLYDYMKKLSVFTTLNTAPNATTTYSVNLPLLTYSHLAIVVLFVLVAFFIIPAAIFNSIEKDWDYLDGLYYCFISLSTIGLGDYIPGDQQEQPYRVFYKIATTFYLILGIMFVMLLLNVVTQIPQLNMAKLFSLESEIDPERQLLADASTNSPSYCRQVDDEEDSVVHHRLEQQNSFDSYNNIDSNNAKSKY